MPEFLVKLEGITKIFPGVKALDNVDFDVRPGEVHALVGENGAGKSTLIKILSGAHKPTSGRILIEGKEYHSLTPLQAKESGISVVHQEPALVGTQTIAESLFMSKIASKRFGMISWRKMNKKAKELLKEVGIDVSPTRMVSELSPGQRQLLDIARSLHEGSKLIILDEPTSSLSEKEVEFLFNAIEKLKMRGTAFVYITHKLVEVERIADRVTVLRDGKVTGRFTKDEIDLEKIVQSMVGRKLAFKYGSHREYRRKRIETRNIGKTILEVRHLGYGKKIKDVSFYLREGEILGLYGIIGAGRTETLTALINQTRKIHGEVFLNDKKVRFPSPYSAIVRGIGFVPEDRLQEGLIFAFPLHQNVSLPYLIKNSFKGFFGIVKKKKEVELAKRVIKSLRVKAVHPEVPVHTLSGGNQQKVVVGKWLFIDTSVLILDEPTRGIDVGAKEEIYNLILNLASEGMGVVLSSSELPEIMMLCDRVVVFKDGRTVGEFNVDEIGEDEIIKLATT